MKLRYKLLALVVFLAIHVDGRADCVFVNTNSDPNTVAAFLVNPDGSLTAVAGSPFATGGSGAFDAAVGSIGLDERGSRVYVSNPSSDNVSGFSIAADCTLTLVPGSPFAAGNSALGLEPDPEGNFLYVANFLADNMSVFSIAANGSLTEIAGSPFATASTPFDIVFDPAGGRFFVSLDFAGAVGSFDQAMDGTFTPVAGSPFPAGGFQHGLALNPSATRLYTADFGPDTITGYFIDADGSLTALSGSPFAATVEPIELLVDPSDSFLYATNDNAENIAGFSIDGSGNLTPLAGSPFASDSVGPAGLAQDLGGRFLYVANGGFSGNPDVSVFARAMDGSLSPIAGSPFATGGTGNATGIAFLSTGDLSLAQTESADPATAGLGPGNLTYVVTLTNNGVNAATGITVDEILSLPTGVTVDSITPSVGSFAGTTWTVPSLAASASATLTVILTVGAGTDPGIDVIGSAATITGLNESDGNPTNDSTNELTSVVSPGRVTASKSVSGDFRSGGTVTYTITLTNISASDHPDNPGNEFVDILPSELTLTSANVASGGGVVVADVPSNTVTWNGVIPGGGQVVIEIDAVISDTLIPGQRITNQGQVSFDSTGEGINIISAPTGNPEGAGSDDPTDFRLVTPADIPVLNPVGLGVLLLLLAAASFKLLPRRKS